jgi:hypothetical protein
MSQVVEYLPSSVRPKTPVPHQKKVCKIFLYNCLKYNFNLSYNLFFDNEES